MRGSYSDWARQRRQLERRGMRWVLGVILAGALALPMAAIGQTTQPDEGMSKWLANLGADDWNLRERAESELVKYGPDAAPALRGLIQQSSDPEVQSRAQEALRRIGSFMYPAFVTVHLHQTPAKEAFLEIAEAAHTVLPAADDEMWNRSLPTVTIEAEREPFWSVV